MLKKPDFTRAAIAIFDGRIALSKSTGKQIGDEAERFVRKLLVRELKGAKTKGERLAELAQLAGPQTLNAVIDGLSGRDAAACLKRCDPGAPELVSGGQADMTDRLKALASGAAPHPLPPKDKRTAAKAKAKPKAPPKPTFEALSLDGRRKR